MESSLNELPNGMILLSTKMGSDLLEGTSLKKNSIVDFFKNQTGRSNCGLASLSLIINAINAYRVKISDPNLSEEEYLELEAKMNKGEPLHLDEFDVINHGAVKDYIKAADVEKNGLTLLELKHIAMLLGYGVNTHFAYNENLEIGKEKRSELMKMVEENSDCFLIKTPQELKEFISSYISRPVTGLILNYDMKKVGYKELFGHHSPIAAINQDSVLVMDVWVDTDPVWVDYKSVFDAACSFDDASGLPRGLLHIFELL